MTIENCVIRIVVLIIIAGVLIWAVKSVPLDQDVKTIGRVALIVLFVLVLVVQVLDCAYGLSGRFLRH